MYTTDISSSQITATASETPNETQALPKSYVSTRASIRRPILSLLRRTGYPHRALQLSWIGLVRR